MREILVLPHKRTLQRIRAKMPDGSGYQSDCFTAVGQKIQAIARRLSDWEMHLSWDATGHAKYCYFSKQSGAVEGLVCDPQSFNTELMFAQKVNCWMVTSPDPDINIRYPVTYYHCNTLNCADIRRQWYEVMAGLDSVGIRVISNICDCAGEHMRFFKLVLKQYADEDDTLLVRLKDTCAIPDPPHANKNLRNILRSSGLSAKHTRCLCRRGWRITWRVIDATHTVATTLPNGQRRIPCALRELNWDVVHPDGVLRLRVSLSVIVFSSKVRDFIMNPKNLQRIIKVSNLRKGDVLATVEYMAKANELFNIMNCREPLYWNEKDDGVSW